MTCLFRGFAERRRCLERCVFYLHSMHCTANLSLLWHFQFYCLGHMRECYGDRESSLFITSGRGRLIRPSKSHRHFPTVGGYWRSLRGLRLCSGHHDVPLTYISSPDLKVSGAQSCSPSYDHASRRHLTRHRNIDAEPTGIAQCTHR